MTTITPEQEVELAIHAAQVANTTLALVGVGDMLRLKLILRDVVAEVEALLNFAKSLED